MGTYKLQENAFTLKRELADIEKILSYGSCSESQRKYLNKKRLQIEEKLKKMGL